MKKVAVLQSNYIPWKGYFDIIHDVDEFIFYDEVQYTKNDWRNRNKIVVNGQEIWLTIPCGNDLKRKIYEVEIKENRWQKKHYDTLWMAYHNSPYWKKYEEFFEYTYLKKKWRYLFEINRYLIKHISRDFLKINTVFADSRDYITHGKRNEKLISLLKASGTDVYISGPSARNYIDEEQYKMEGIKIIWKDYSNYPKYSQNSKEFHDNVSILDLLFNVGDEACYYIWGKNRG